MTSAGGRRPVVVICHGPTGLVEQLARAGFAAVSLDPQAPGDLEVVLDALGRGALGVTAEVYALVGGTFALERAATDPRVRALVTWETAEQREAARVRVPWLVVRDANAAVDAVVQWLARQLA